MNISYWLCIMQSERIYVLGGLGEGGLAKGPSRPPERLEVCLVISHFGFMQWNIALKAPMLLCSHLRSELIIWGYVQA